MSTATSVTVEDAAFGVGLPRRCVTVGNLRVTTSTTRDVIRAAVGALSPSSTATTPVDDSGGYVLRSQDQGIVLPRNAALFSCGIVDGARLILERATPDGKPVLLDARIVRLADRGEHDDDDDYLVDVASETTGGASGAGSVHSPSAATSFRLDVVMHEESGRPVYRLDGNDIPSYSIGELKKLIEPFAKLPAEDQRLMVGNRMRSDDELLSACLGVMSDAFEAMSVVPSVRVYKRKLTLSLRLVQGGKTVQIHGLLPSDRLQTVLDAVTEALDKERVDPVSGKARARPADSTQRGRGPHEGFLFREDGTTPQDVNVPGDDSAGSQVRLRPVQMMDLRRPPDGGVIKLVYGRADWPSRTRKDNIAGSSKTKSADYSTSSVAQWGSPARSTTTNGQPRHQPYLEGRKLDRDRILDTVLRPANDLLRDVAASCAHAQSLLDSTAASAEKQQVDPHSSVDRATSALPGGASGKVAKRGAVASRPPLPTNRVTAIESAHGRAMPRDRANRPTSLSNATPLVTSSPPRSREGVDNTPLWITLELAESMMNAPQQVVRTSSRADKINTEHDEHVEPPPTSRDTETSSTPRVTLGPYDTQPDSDILATQLAAFKRKVAEDRHGAYAARDNSDAAGFTTGYGTPLVVTLR